MIRPKETLYRDGADLMRKFCAVNGLRVPDLRIHDASVRPWPFKSNCAYYRPEYIVICVERCASIGVAGQAWSAPGNTVDRTPYGVISHEVGHHVDWTRGSEKSAYFSDFSVRIRALSGEEKISSYAPNDAEWFAEMMRLFITNPDLLRRIRPKTHDILIAEGLKPAVELDWRAAMAGAPERTIQAAARKIEAANASNRPPEIATTRQFSMF